MTAMPKTDRRSGRARPVFTVKDRKEMFRRIERSGPKGYSLEMIRRNFARFGQEVVDAWIEAMVDEGVIEIREVHRKYLGRGLIKKCYAIA